jgi:hypothetical protein
MSKLLVHSAALLTALLLGLPVRAQSSNPAESPSGPADVLPDGLLRPTDVDDQFLPNQGVGLRFVTDTKTSARAQLAIRQGKISSVPVFFSSFSFQGGTFPFAMVGSAPRQGGTTEVKTQLIPISLYFEGYADANGEPIVLDVNTVLPQTLTSPNFRRAVYETGFTQFADAVQRAQFFQTMQPDWHTMLAAPHLLKPIIIVVPRGLAGLYRVPSGRIFAIVDTDFFVSQLNTIVQAENLDVHALPIALTTDVLLARGAKIQNCCVLGFHTAFDTGQSGDAVAVQTFVWASWVDDGIFGGTLADVTPLSHEISEWMNNPFNANVVPAWAFPNGTGGCQNNLETGDPIALFANSGFPVTIAGFTYHPQSQALLPWFQRTPQSNAARGAFSFPDSTLLTGPAEPCGGL